MTEDGDRASAGTPPASWTTVEAPRAADEPEWELFLRESPEEPLRHAGSVTAPDAAAAHERATDLFPVASTLWCCPAGEVARFAGRDLGAGYREDESPEMGAGTGGDSA